MNKTILSSNYGVDDILKEKCIFDMDEQCYALREKKKCKGCKFFKSEKDYKLVDLKGSYIKTAAKRGVNYEGR